jgi:hypothetical protein
MHNQEDRRFALIFNCSRKFPFSDIVAACRRESNYDSKSLSTETNACGVNEGRTEIDSIVPVRSLQYEYCKGSELITTLRALPLWRNFKITQTGIKPNTGF